MTPADLAALVKTIATAVPGVSTNSIRRCCPGSVTVERPRNPEHEGLRHQSGASGRRRSGANPRKTGGWLADALADADGIASAEVAGRVSSTSVWKRRRKGVIVRNIAEAGIAYGGSALLLDGQRSIWTFVSTKSDRSDPHRWDPVGGGQ